MGLYINEIYIEPCAQLEWGTKRTSSVVGGNKGESCMVSEDAKEHAEVKEGDIVQIKPFPTQQAMSRYNMLFGIVKRIKPATESVEVGKDGKSLKSADIGVEFTNSNGPIWFYDDELQVVKDEEILNQEKPKLDRVKVPELDDIVKYNTEQLAKTGDGHYFCIMDEIIFGTKLAWATMVGGILIRCRFIECDLSNADFTKAIIIDSDFWQCNLRGAIFRGAEIARSRFIKCNISQLNMETANKSGCEFKENREE
jgi:hypothetical protein